MKNNTKKQVQAIPNVAFVGIGRWGSVLMREFDKVANIVSYFHGGNVENEKGVKENYPNIKKALSLEEMFNNPDIDAVVIATPVDTHFQLAKEALHAGKHVFVEKPLAKKTSEAEELASIADKQNLLLFTGYVFLYSPVFQKLKEILDGKSVEHVEFSWKKLGTFKEDIIWNLLSHDVAMAIELFGEPEYISLLEKTGVVSDVDIIYAKAKFGKNLSCMFHTNRVARKKEKAVSVKGSDFYYVWEDDALYSLNNNTEFDCIFKSEEQPLARECGEFIEQIKGAKVSEEKHPISQLGVLVTKALEEVK